jgi:hypothetical protein
MIVIKQAHPIFPYLMICWSFCEAGSGFQTIHYLC